MPLGSTYPSESHTVRDSRTGVAIRQVTSFQRSTIIRSIIFLPTTTQGSDFFLSHIGQDYHSYTLRIVKEVQSFRSPIVLTSTSGPAIPRGTVDTPTTPQAMPLGESTWKLCEKNRSPP